MLLSFAQHKNLYEIVGSRFVKRASYLIIKVPREPRSCRSEFHELNGELCWSNWYSSICIPTATTTWILIIFLLYVIIFIRKKLINVMNLPIYPNSKTAGDEVIEKRNDRWWAVLPFPYHFAAILQKERPLNPYICNIYIWVKWSNLS